MDGTHRTKKRAAAILLGFFAAAAIAMPSAQAADRTVSELIPVGQTVGVKLFSDGVLVVGFSDGESPAKDCGLKEGDVITAIGGQSLDTIEEFRQLLAENGEDAAALTVKRGSRTIELSAEPEKDEDGEYRLGAWVRDSMAGIGTVTFYDPQTGAFAALGHGITDVDTGKLMPLSRGMIAAVTLFIAVINWNDYYSYMMFIGNKTKLQPFAWVLHRMLTDKSLMNQVRNGAASLGFTLPPPMALRMATIICATLPIIIIYPFIQPYFTQGMTLGAVKE